MTSEEYELPPESEETETSKESEESELSEEEYGEEFSIQDLEFFIEVTESWENILSGKMSIKELSKAKRVKEKAKPRRRRRK